MLPDTQLLTLSTLLANYNSGDSSSTVRAVAALGFIFVHPGTHSTEEKKHVVMSHHHRAHRSSASTESELWFSTSSSSRGQQQPSRASEQSAYRATTNRLSMSSTSSSSPRALTEIPSIHTTIDTNKPLPPSPTDSERKRRKPAYLRSLLGRSSSSHLDPAYLQPQAPQSTTSANLSVETRTSHHYHTYSRSMPSSPYEYNQVGSSPHPSSIPRANSAAANYPDSIEYEPYTPPLQQQSHATYFVRPPRSSSMNASFETTPPRARTFPVDTSVASPTIREGVSNRPRPHTWLSPTESFSDPAQFSLFVQATTGLPQDSDPFSPTGPPQLQGSLFARRSGNDVIPLPLQNSTAAVPRHTHLWTDWQDFETPPFSHPGASVPASNLPRPERHQQFQETPHMAAVNRELELLGLEDNNAPDDELPDYAQSQAEAYDRRRAEASARARELESRWRRTRHS
jgi:hypothetical protein